MMVMIINNSDNADDHDDIFEAMPIPEGTCKRRESEKEWNWRTKQENLKNYKYNKNT